MAPFVRNAVLLVMLGVLGATIEAQPLSQWLGTWILNVEQSTYSAGPPPYRRGRFTIEPWREGVRVVYDLVRVRGGITHMEWTGRFDGNDYPVHGVDAAVTNAYRIVDARTLNVVVKVDGGPAATSRVTLSNDGKRVTTVTSGRNAQGASVTTTTVYEKQ